MTDAPAAALNLSDVRKEIDAIDDAILDLLGRRFAVVEKVGALKQAQAATSPLRPAREAQVLQRLTQRARAAGLDPAIAGCLWPVIFAEADLLQAPVKIVVAETLSRSVPGRLAIQRRFGRIPVETVTDEAAVLAAAQASPFAVAIVAAVAGWLDPYLEHSHSVGGSRLHVMGVLDGGLDRLVVIGQTALEATSKDETLVISRGSLPRDFPVRPLWSMASGAHQLSALSGYLAEKEAPLLGIIRSNAALGLKVVARYPSGNM
jgi:chorismate mutase